MVARLVVLASGSGTLLQALLDAGVDPAFGANVVAVGSDRTGTLALDRARGAGLDVFEVVVGDFASRADWDRALTAAVAGHDPDLVVLAGFMKLMGDAFLSRFGGRTVNSHPALLPVVPRHARPPRRPRVRGEGDRGNVVPGRCRRRLGSRVAQVAVPVEEDDDEVTLHERIKVVERMMLVDTVGRMAREGYTVEGRRVTIP